MNTIQDIVNEINADDNWAASMMAGDYAADAAKDAVEKGLAETLTDSDIEGHLDVLFLHGAEFDYPSAKERGVQLINAKQGDIS